ncbi:MAG: hypothetical protein ACK5HA_19985 [Planctomycetaceae bacterium]
MPEFRLDCATGQVVLMAPEREAREGGLGEPLDPRRHCPFCPGSEALTPHEVAARRPPGSPANAPDWQVRVFANRYPAVAAPPEETRDTPAPPGPAQPTVPGWGWHEVVVETRHHPLGLADLPVAEIRWVLEIWRERLCALRELGNDPRQPRCEWVQIFKNSGPKAGASQPHAHSQIFGLPFVPAGPAAEYDHAADRGPSTTSPLPLDETLCLLQTEHYRASCPRVSRFMYEVHLHPLRPECQFAQEPLAQLAELAALLRRVLQALNSTANTPDYNLILHTAPLHRMVRGWRWRLEILPRLYSWGGLELGSGLVVNPLLPEQACQRLTANLSRER